MLPATRFQVLAQLRAGKAYWVTVCKLLSRLFKEKAKKNPPKNPTTLPDAISPNRIRSWTKKNKHVCRQQATFPPRSVGCRLHASAGRAEWSRAPWPTCAHSCRLTPAPRCSSPPSPRCAGQPAQLQHSRVMLPWLAM